MRRWVAIVVGVGLIVGSAAAVGPAATAGTGVPALKGQPVLAMSDQTTCAIRESYRVYCWGSNGSFELGRSVGGAPTSVAPAGSSLVDAIAIYGSTVNAGTGGSFCVIKSDRNIACWGDGDWRRLGNNSPTSVSSPTVISGISNVMSMGMGDSHSCAVKQDGTVWCAGGYGGSNIISPSGSGTYAKIPGASNAVAVTVGTNHACYLKLDRSVWCWGSNGDGQLGDGTTTARFVPVKVKGLSDVVAVSSGGYYTCAVRSGGTVACWGSNTSYQLGRVPSPGFSSSTPVVVSDLKSVTSLATTGTTACAISGSAVKCWGGGANYILGDAQTNFAPAPVTSAVGLKKPTQLAMGFGTTCEIADGGRVWCWGYNLQGEAGNGLTTPVRYGTGPADDFGFALSPRAIPVLNSAPGRPTGSSKATKKVTISWKAPSTSNGTSKPKDYVIQYRLKGTSTWKTFKDSVSTKTSVTVTGLTKGKQYQFRVQPKNWAGKGKVSAASAYIKVK